MPETRLIIQLPQNITCSAGNLSQDKLKVPRGKETTVGRRILGRQVLVRTVGDKVTSETIKKYIQYHRHEEKTPKQLRFDF